MTTFGFLLFLFATCSGLQFPLQYEYKYLGVVSTGFLHGNSEATESKMAANVKIQVADKEGTIWVKLSDVHLSEQFTEPECAKYPNARNTPVFDTSLLEHPFKAHLLGNNPALEVTSTEPLWMTNLKKGVLSMIRNTPLDSNFIPSAEEKNFVPVSGRMQDTIHGRCRVYATLHELPAVHANRRRHDLDSSLTEDVQSLSAVDKLSSYSSKKSKSSKKKHSSRKKYSSSKSSKKGGSSSSALRESVPKMDKDLWHVMRTVDFDDCEDRVGFQNMPFGVDQKVGGGQTEYLQGRSSVGQYLLRGSWGAFRVERAQVEGVVTWNPIGIKSKYMQVTTNQTLTLLSVSTQTDSLETASEGQVIKTWMQEVISPATPPSVSQKKEWVFYSSKGGDVNLVDAVTGLETKINADYKENLIDVIDNICNDVFNDLRNFLQDDWFQKGAEYLKALPKLQIEEVFDKYFEYKDEFEKETPADNIGGEVLLKIALATGSDRVYEVLLDKMQEPQTASVYMVLAIGLKSPRIIPKLMKHLLTLEIDKMPLMTSTAWVNMASILRQFCVGQSMHDIRYMSELYGDEACHSSMVETFNAHLQDKFENANRTWQRSSVVVALSKLGSGITIPFLSKVAVGMYESDPKLRNPAIYGLARWYQPIHAKKQIVYLLNSIASDIGENELVRQAAVASLISWAPEASWWHALARLSWRDPNRRMASFITSVLEGVANSPHPFFIKQAKIASVASKLSKPTSPSLKYSYNYMITANAQRIWASSTEHLSWMADPDSILPNEIYYFIMSELGGFHIINFEMGIATDGLVQAAKSFLQHLGEENSGVNPDSISAKIARDFYNRIMGVINPIDISPDQRPEINLYARMFNTMFIYLPLRHKTLPTYSSSDLFYFGMELMSGIAYRYFEYLKPTEFSIFLPSDMGLPIIVHADFEYGMYFKTDVLATMDTYTFTMESFQNLRFSFNTTLKLESQIFSSIQVLTPWFNSKMATYMDNFQSIKLPYFIEIGTVATDDTNVQVSLEIKPAVSVPSHDNALISMMYLWNKPKVAYLPIQLIQQDMKKAVYFVKFNKELNSHESRFMSNYTGLYHALDWSADIPGYITLPGIDELSKIREEEWLVYRSVYWPSENYFYLHFGYLPNLSKTESVVFTLSFLKRGEDKSSDFTQYEQKSSLNYEQYGQQQSFDVDFSEFQESQSFVGPEAEVVDTISISTPMKQRAEKLIDNNVVDGNLFVVSLRTDFIGQDKNISYETMVSVSRSVTERLATKWKLVLLSSPNYEEGSVEKAVCADIKHSMPHFYEMDTTYAILKRNLNTDLNITLDLECKGNPVGSAKGTLSISEKQQKSLKYLYQKCDYDPNDQLVTFFNHAFYDMIDINVHWKKVCDTSNYPILNGIQNAAVVGLSYLFGRDTCSSGSTDNDEYNFSIKAKKSISKDNWGMELQMNDKKVKKDKSLILSNLEEVLYLNHFIGIQDNPANLDEFGISQKCIITNETVRMFDGFTYSSISSNCWTVALHECNKHDGWMVLVRENNKVPQIRYINVNLGIVIEMTQHIVKANGKEVELFDHNSETVLNEDGKRIGYFMKEGNYVMFKEAVNEIKMVIKDKIEIELEGMTKYTCGLCGNRGDQVYGAMIGPRGCIFGDAETFINSWTASSDSCDYYTLLEKRSKVESLQESCEKYPESRYHYVKDSVMNSCVLYDHRVIQRTGQLCVSQEAVPHCSNAPGCSHTGILHQMVKYNCWPEITAPPELSSGVEYIKGPVAIPWVNTIMEQEAFGCTKP